MYLIINIDIRIIILFRENIVYTKEIIEDGENEDIDRYINSRFLSWGE